MSWDRVSRSGAVLDPGLGGLLRAGAVLLVFELVAQSGTVLVGLGTLALKLGGEAFGLALLALQVAGGVVLVVPVGTPEGLAVVKPTLPEVARQAERDAALVALFNDEVRGGGEG